MSDELPSERGDMFQYSIDMALKVRRLEIESDRIRKAYEALKASRDERAILWRKSEDQNQELRGAITQLYYKCDLTRVPQSWIEAIERLLKKD